MAQEKFYRKANISSTEATNAIAKKFANEDVTGISVVKRPAKDAAEAKAAGVKLGDLIFEATVHVGEFPPSDDKSSDSEDSSSKDDSGSSDDGGSDDSGEDKGSSDSTPDFTKADDADPSADPNAEEKPLKGDDGIITLLKELLDTVKGGGGLGPDAAGPDAGLDGGLDAGPPGTDVGSPIPGDAAGGLGGPPGAGAPLPPPVPPKSPMGGGAFAHYDPTQAEVYSIRTEAGALKTKEILAQAEEVYPTHQVAQIRRTGSVQLNGEEVNLAEAGIALVTLVKK